MTANASCRYQIYAEWRPFWNLSRPVLLEKSPQHMLITRLLQFWFTPQRSHFIAVIRHPFGTMGQLLSNASLFHVRRHRLDCGSGAVKHWLESNRMMLEDMHRLDHAVLLRFETFALGDQHGAGM